jgi:hypothetical protein
MCYVGGEEEARFDNLLLLEEDERPILLVGMMRNNSPNLISLWGAAKHLDSPYSRTLANGAVLFC